MSKQVGCISTEMAEWLTEQPVFFVATAPMAQDGHINCSPKGGDCFRVLGPLEVAYLDYTGSGAETAAHIKENGRIVLMFCAFKGRPEVVRLHGQGEVLTPQDKAYTDLVAHFPPNPGARAVVRMNVSRVSTSCGFSVPLMDFQTGRDTLDRWAAAKGQDGLKEYRHQKNTRSIDDLPAFAIAQE